MCCRDGRFSRSFDSVDEEPCIFACHGAEHLKTPKPGVVWGWGTAAAEDGGISSRDDVGALEVFGEAEPRNSQMLPRTHGVLCGVLHIGITGTCRDDDSSESERSS